MLKWTRRSCAAAVDGERLTTPAATTTLMMMNLRTCMNLLLCQRARLANEQEQGHDKRGYLCRRPGSCSPLMVRGPGALTRSCRFPPPTAVERDNAPPPR